MRKLASTLYITLAFLFAASCVTQTLPPPIKGAFFEPDTASGSSWLVNYTSFAWQRPETITELQELKSKTGLTHVLIFLSSARELAYPVPSAANFTNLNLFLSDARDAGFKVILFIGTPCVISNAFASTINDGTVHVGGHFRGEVLNGYTLFWDVPYCATDNVNIVRQWLLASLGGIDPNLYTTIESVTLGGMHAFAFGTESNYFYAESGYKSTVANFYQTIIPSLRAAFPNFTYGVSVLLSWWKYPNASVYDQAAYVTTNISSADYYDVTSRLPQVNPNTLLAYIMPSKLVMSDFSLRSLASQGIPQSTVCQWWIAQSDINKVRGWWIYGYRDTGYGGLRSPDSAGGVWNEGVVSAIRSSTGGVCQ